ncbi:MAG TPA: phosphatase PAP2 family protein [Blastocatellia bacterium]|nr:phosphatase PAP2 family protein [Blastocatellia bacterium]
MSFWRRIQIWQIVVTVFVIGYVLLAAVTNTFRFYHWLLLLAVPGALLSDERGKKLFFDWSPIFFFWLAYDRLRLLQPLLLDRVYVRGPFRAELSLFGWLASGRVPPNAARDWLAAHSNSFFWPAFHIAMQCVYMSHLFFLPLVLVALWIAGLTRTRWRMVFVNLMWSLVTLNVFGLIGYLVFPAAPPWWITIHGLEQPTQALVAQTSLASGMDGSIIQHMIATAPDWFAAIPSMHGAYPILLFLVLRRFNVGKLLLAIVALYAAAMWTATVVLNQHYIIDLIIGGSLSIITFLIYRLRFVQSRINSLV